MTYGALCPFHGDYAKTSYHHHAIKAKNREWKELEHSARDENKNLPIKITLIFLFSSIYYWHSFRLKVILLQNANVASTGCPFEKLRKWMVFAFLLVIEIFVLIFQLFRLNKFSALLNTFSHGTPCKKYSREFFPNFFSKLWSLIMIYDCIICYICWQAESRLRQILPLKGLLL